MMQVLTLAICILAFAALALATDRQQHAVLARQLPPHATRALRTAGWCCLGVALWIIVADRGWSLGLVVYSGQTSLAAGVVYVALIWRERR